MGADVDFEDVAIGGAGDFLQRFAALSAASVGIGQSANFIAARQMLVMASAMPFAAWLLPAFAWRLVVAVVIAVVGVVVGRGGGFGFSAVESAFQLPELAFQELYFFFPFGLALDGTLMLGSPVVGLQPQFEELSPQRTAVDPEQNKENGKFAKASPEPDQGVTKIRLGIVENNNRCSDRSQRSMLGWKNHQGIGIAVHAMSS
jgi:hypothetical protein